MATSRTWAKVQTQVNETQLELMKVGRRPLAMTKVLAAGVLTSVLGVGCTQHPSGPLLTIAPVDKESDKTFADTPLLRSTQTSFEVINEGDADAVLRDVSPLGLSITAPFELLTSGTCISGLVLPAQTGRCTINIRFSPLEEGAASQEMTLAYSRGEESSAVSKSNVSLRAKGYLDCSIALDLSTSRSDGIAAADMQMAEDAVRGTADGEALTFDDGYADGYSSGYATGYAEGFDHNTAYPAGYDTGYDLGHQAGLADSASCVSGDNDGFNAGYGDGNATGYHQGYPAGFTDGYRAGDGVDYSLGYADGSSLGQQQGRNDGYTAGENDGYSDGYAACYPDGHSDGYDWGYYDGSRCGSFNFIGIGKLRSEEVDRDKYLQLCFEQGYSDTYSMKPYWNAFNAAKDANVEYQAGRAEGIPVGRSAGYNVGLVDGYAAGISDGETVGFADGAAEAYLRCYNDSYPIGYDAGFAAGYDSGYNAGYSSGYYDAADASYDAGYIDGFNAMYTTSYDSGYEAGYSVEWDSSCDSGYNTGYSDGYGDGYNDGDYDYCY